MPVQKRGADFFETEAGKEFTQALKEMAQDTAFNTDPTFSANSEVTVTVKQQKTRDQHVKRVIAELKQGKRRPCCWIGCIHRSDKPISKSVQWVLDRQK